MRARSPHVLSPAAVPPLTDEERSSESRREPRKPQGISPELSNLMNQVLATERFGPLRRGISCYARPTYAVGSRQMQRTCTRILKDGKLVCRGAGDSHLPRSLRARSPHVLSPSAVPPLKDEERSSESRRDSASPQGIPPELSNLINQVLAIERIGPLRRGISCYARPTYAVGSRQMQRTCTRIFLKNGKLICRGAGDSHLPRSPHVLFPRRGISCYVRPTYAVGSRQMQRTHTIFL